MKIMDTFCNVEFLSLDFLDGTHTCSIHPWAPIQPHVNTLGSRPRPGLSVSFISNSGCNLVNSLRGSEAAKAEALSKTLSHAEPRHQQREAFCHQPHFRAVDFIIDQSHTFKNTSCYLWGSVYKFRLDAEYPSSELHGVSLLISRIPGSCHFVLWLCIQKLKRPPRLIIACWARFGACRGDSLGKRGACGKCTNPLRGR